MEGIKNVPEPDWHKEIDWNESDHEVRKQISFLYADTCDRFKDQRDFQRTFHELTREFAAAHPGVEGDKLYASWMITRLRKKYLGKA